MTRRVRISDLGMDADLPEHTRHHLVDVLRMRDGDSVVAFDGRGHEVDAVLRLAPARLETAGAIRSPPSPRAVTLVLCVLKHQAMDLAIRMATEAGAHAIQPVLSKRTVAKGERLERWHRIASGAAEQCGRATVPQIHPLAPFAAVLGTLTVPIHYGVMGAGPPTASDTATALVIGPAGGLAPNELVLLDRLQALPIGLGPHTLRAETAAAVGVALLTR